MAERTDTHAHNPPGSLRRVDDDRLLSIARQETLSDETPDLAAAVLGDRARLSHVEDELARWDAWGEFTVEGVEPDFASLSYALERMLHLSETGQLQLAHRVLTSLVAEASRVAQRLRGGVVVRSRKEPEPVRVASMEEFHETFDADAVASLKQQLVEMTEAWKLAARNASEARQVAQTRRERADVAEEEAASLRVEVSAKNGAIGRLNDQLAAVERARDHFERLADLNGGAAALRRVDELNEVNRRLEEMLANATASTDLGLVTVERDVALDRVKDLEGEVQRLVQGRSDAHRAEVDELRAQLGDAREQAVEAGQRAVRAEAALQRVHDALDGEHA